jgi:hypothetical protein
MVCHDVTSSIKSFMLVRFITAPSWSWASVPYSILYPAEQNLHLQRKKKVLLVAHILDAALTQVGSDHFGTLAGGYITISADVRPMKRSPIPAPMHLFDSETTFVRYDDTYSNECRQVFDGAYFLALSCVLETSVRVRGLVVEPTGQADEYRRIGAFEYRVEEREEYKGFDIENSTRTIVMLV